MNSYKDTPLTERTGWGKTLSKENKSKSVTGYSGQVASKQGRSLAGGFQGGPGTL